MAEQRRGKKNESVESILGVKGLTMRVGRIGGVLAACLLVAGLNAASAATATSSMPSRPAPADGEVARITPPPAEWLDSIAVSQVIELAEPTETEIQTKRSMETTGYHVAGIGLQTPVGTKSAIVRGNQSPLKIQIRSAGAIQLRVGLRFSDSGQYTMTAYSPGDAGHATTSTQSVTQLNDSNMVLWSPVTAGDTQEIVVQRTPDDATGAWSVSVVMTSHFTEGVDSTIVAPKAFQDSQSCQIDLVCLYDALNAEEQQRLLLTSRGVAKMIFTRQDGLSYTCTGTLLNSASYPKPLFLTAYHCISDSSAASSLSTLWFFSRTSCGVGGPAQNTTQVAGGANVVYSNQALDVALLQLNQMPPVLANYSGWNPNPLSIGTEILAIHHPSGDVKKASFGAMQGVYPYTLQTSDIGTFAPNTFDVVTWQYGTVEHGSSGSGLFSYDALTGYFYHRGTLTTGSTACPAPGHATSAFYSRFENYYPYIAAALNQPPTAAAIEYHHASFDHYFITPVAAEIALLDAHAPPFQEWSRTGFSFKVYAPATAPTGSVATCRFFNSHFAPKSSHFYAPKGLGCEATIASFPDWGLEDDKLFNTMLPSAGGACPSGTIPVYRLYNNGMGGAPNHRFVTSLTERQNMINKGYAPEGNGIGVGMCVPP